MRDLLRSMEEATSYDDSVGDEVANAREVRAPVLLALDELIALLQRHNRTIEGAIDGYAVASTTAFQRKDVRGNAGFQRAMRKLIRSKWGDDPSAEAVYRMLILGQDIT